MTTESQRAITIRPGKSKPEDVIATFQDKVGDLEAGAKMEEEAVDNKVVDTETRPMSEKTGNTEEHSEEQQCEELQDKVEDLNVRVAWHFEDANDEIAWKPPMVKAPLQPTKEEWLRHQLTHTRRTLLGAGIVYQRERYGIATKRLTREPNWYLTRTEVSMDQ